MQRKDVQIGVEYAATAPLAYGKEPRSSPRRVRFTDTRSGPWLRVFTIEYGERGGSATGGPGWVTIDTKIFSAKSPEGIKALAELPHSHREALIAKYGVWEEYQRKTISGNPRVATRQVLPHPLPAEVGDQLTYADASIKGGLPGEVLRWREGEPIWVPTLVQPADIHRTWAEVEAKEIQREADSAARDASARVPELNRLLAAIGLDSIMRVERLGHGTESVTISLIDRNGERTLAALTAWAAEHDFLVLGDHETEARSQ